MPPALVEIPANLAAALGTQAQRKQPVGLGRRLMQMGEDAASLDGHREVDRVDRPDPVHAAEGEDDVVAVLGRDPAADEPGVAALRHDRQPRLGADAHDRRNLAGRTRPHDKPRRAAIKPPRLNQKRLQIVRIGNPSRRPNRRFDPLQDARKLHR